MIVENYVKRLEAMDILISPDVFFQHEVCDMDGTCPIVLKLKDITQRAGKAYEEVCNVEVPSTRVELPEIADVALSVTISGQLVKIPIPEEYIYRDSFQVISKQGLRSLESWGKRCYEEAERKLKVKEDALIIPPISPEDIKEGLQVMVEDNCYHFILPFDYAPEQCWYRERMHKLSEKHRENLHKSILLEVITSREMLILKVRLALKDLEKFQHYHSSTHSDCWGDINFPNPITIGDLYQIRFLCEGSLGTINGASIYQRNPNPIGLFPSWEDILGDSVPFIEAPEVRYEENEWTTRLR